jgi:hypothetical protein
VLLPVRDFYNDPSEFQSDGLLLIFLNVNDGIFMAMYPKRIKYSIPDGLSPLKSSLKQSL